MNRSFDVGDRVICSQSGVIGKVLRFYIPTTCSEQTMVLTDDGRQYHAPTSTWRKIDELDEKTRAMNCVIKNVGIPFDVACSNLQSFNQTIRKGW